MARNTWTLYTLESGDVWTLGTSIYVPNNQDGLVIEEISTTSEANLIDGSKAFITPESLYIKTALDFVWYQVELSFVEQIRDYQRNAESLKIVTGVTGRDFIGRFTNVRATWITGQADLYDLEAIFLPMQSLE